MNSAHANETMLDRFSNTVKTNISERCKRIQMTPFVLSWHAYGGLFFANHNSFQITFFLLSLIFLLIFPVLGDPRVNQNPAFLALGIIFYRFHNLLAAKIQQQRPDWEDEDVFQAARRRVIATLQVLKKC